MTTAEATIPPRCKAMDAEIVNFDSDEELERTLSVQNKATKNGGTSSFTQLNIKLDHPTFTQPFFPSSEPDSARVVTEKREPTQQVQNLLEPSRTARDFIGQRIPLNTRKANKNAIVIFAQFVLDLVCGKPGITQYTHLAPAAHDLTNEVPGVNNNEKSLLRIILNGRAASSGFDENCEKRLRHFLIEFCVGYVSKTTGKHVEPSSMLTYIRSIQRRLNQLGFPVNLFSGPNFADSRHGLVSVLDNRFAHQQSKGSGTKSHNILSIEDVKSIFESEYCNKQNAEGFRNRLIFSVGLAIGARTTELWMLEVSQFKLEVIDSKEAYVYYPKVGSSSGESKNHKGGMKYVSYRPRAIPIVDIELLGGRLNIFRLLREYFNAREKKNLAHERLFLNVNVGKKGDPEKFFKPQAIGRNKMSSIIKEVCQCLGIRGQGAAEHVTAHGLRATMISLLISAGYSDASIVLRTGHRDSRSLQSYHNLKGQNGVDQLASLFGEKRQNAKFVASCARSDQNTAFKRVTTLDKHAESNNHISTCPEPPEKRTKVSIEQQEDSSSGIELFGGQFSATNCTINVTVHKK